MKSTKGFYTIFNIAIQRDEHSSPYWPTRIQFDFKDIGIFVRSIHLVETRRLRAEYVPPDNSGRYAFWLLNRANDDARAQRVIDAFLATIALLYKNDFSRMAPFDEGPVAYWLPERMLRHGYFLKQSDLRKYDPSLEFRIGNSATIHQPIVKTAWKLLPVVILDPYFDAVHFYQASINDFCFLGDAISEVLYGDISQPVSRSEFARAENAVLNAFKAVEAIVGDPPKDDKKFLKKLWEVGIDPSMMVGYMSRGLDKGMTEREPIAEKIRKMSNVRDKKAAHGSTKSDRRITYFEIMDFQALAEAVVRIALEHQLKRQNES